MVFLAGLAMFLWIRGQPEILLGVRGIVPSAAAILRSHGPRCVGPFVTSAQIADQRSRSPRSNLNDLELVDIDQALVREF